MSCSNNLHNIGLACLNFHDTVKHLPVTISRWPEDYNRNHVWIGPTGGKMATTNGGPGYIGKGWIVDILPAMEETALSDAIVQGLKASPGDFVISGPSAGKGMGAPSFRSMLERQISWLTCPSDPSAVPSPDQFYWDFAGKVITATTSYKGCLGDSNITDGTGGAAPSIDIGTMPDCHNTADCNGLIWRGTYFNPINLKKVVDGTTKTFMVGESVVAQDYHSAAFFSDGDWASCGIPINFFIYPETKDWVVAAPQWEQARGFKSRHPGGAHFVMADGSVHFINEGIDVNTYRGLATRNGSENVEVE
jgi:prepilin-type processing-associated H-X9-DG protein